MTDTVERLRKVAPLSGHPEFVTVRRDLLQTAADEIEAVVEDMENGFRERDAAEARCTKLEALLVEAVENIPRRREWMLWANRVRSSLGGDKK